MGHPLRAIQARTLELLQDDGVADRLVAAGRTSTRLMLHFEDRTARAELGGFSVAGTRFPFILFLSQAETERILADHLAARGVAIERRVELLEFQQDATGVDCTLRHDDGPDPRVRNPLAAWWTRRARRSRGWA